MVKKMPDFDIRIGALRLVVCEPAKPYAAEILVTVEGHGSYAVAFIEGRRDEWNMVTCGLRPFDDPHVGFADVLRLVRLGFDLLTEAYGGD